MKNQWAIEPLQKLKDQIVLLWILFCSQNSQVTTTISEKFHNVVNFMLFFFLILFEPFPFIVVTSKRYKWQLIRMHDRTGNTTCF